MASSSRTKATFATLPREVRDKIYEYMLTKPKTIVATQHASDYGQPEDLGTLRATLHVCRSSPQFAHEAFETFFAINTFRIPAQTDLFCLNRPVYYVEGQGFKSVRRLLR